MAVQCRGATPGDQEARILVDCYPVSVMEDLDLKRIGQFTATDSNGLTHSLDETWSKGPAIVVFLRHFGCLFCREQSAEFREHEAALARDGISVTYVSTGSVRAAQSFKRKMRLTGAVWVDPERELYQAFGFRRSVWALLRPTTWWNGLRALIRGFRQGATRGDPWQNGGVLVARPDGTIAFLFKSKGPGDKPQTDKVISVARKLRPSGQLQPRPVAMV